MLWECNTLQGSAFDCCVRLLLFGFFLVVAVAVVVPTVVVDARKWNLE